MQCLAPFRSGVTLLQLQQNLTTYDHLISNKELENFKNNQYIYKLFKFGQ